jgi:mRNA-degrading endonuclease RelE of RelBE toxin-antitoxin system
MYKVMLGKEVLEHIENWPEKECEELFAFLEHIAEDPIPRTYDNGGSNSADIHYRITPYNFLHLVRLTVSSLKDEETLFVTKVEPRTRLSRFV